MAGSKKQFVVQHTMLGVPNVKSGELHHNKGEVVSADALGDKANVERLLENGAIAPKELSDEEWAAEAEEAALEQSRQADLDPSASPLADHQELTPQQLNADQGKGNSKK